VISSASARSVRIHGVNAAVAEVFLQELQHDIERGNDSRIFELAGRFVRRPSFRKHVKEMIVVGKPNQPMRDALLLERRRHPFGFIDRHVPVLTAMEQQCRREVR